jgi:S-adenosylmethionine:tRNA-ribosyltransferase-isomerase (queuine synthetase)
VLKRFKIKHAKNIVNFDETGTWIGYARSKDVIVPIEIMELYKVSLENHKSIMICEAIRANGSKPPPPYIIIPDKKIIET